MLFQKNIISQETNTREKIMGIRIGGERDVFILLCCLLNPILFIYLESML